MISKRYIHFHWWYIQSNYRYSRAIFKKSKHLKKKKKHHQCHVNFISIWQIKESYCNTNWVFELCFGLLVCLAKFSWLLGMVYWVKGTDVNMPLGMWWRCVGRGKAFYSPMIKSHSLTVPMPLDCELHMCSSVFLPSWVGQNDCNGL